jgi:pimeloyl-ACP methyl ester carboxylesterase
MRLGRKQHLLLVAGITVLAVMFSAAWWIGERLAEPQPHSVGAPPADLDARAVTLLTERGSEVSGWLIPGSGDRAVLLMHGSGGDRRSMLGRARFLKEAGYATLTIDLQANGESPGERATEGYLESFDAHAAVTYLRSRAGARRVAVIGFSLGGAAALLGPEGPVNADALVLEAVYPTIEEAIANRIRIHLGAWSGWLYPLLTWQLGPRLGLSAADLRPIDRIGAVHAPVFVIGGGADRRTTPAETRRLFAAAGPPKKLWIVPGAVHGDFYAASPEAYRRQLLAFLRAALG